MFFKRKYPANIEEQQSNDEELLYWKIRAIFLPTTLNKRGKVRRIAIFGIKCLTARHIH